MLITSHLSEILRALTYLIGLSNLNEGNGQGSAVIHLAVVSCGETILPVFQFLSQFIATFVKQVTDQPLVRRDGI